MSAANWVQTAGIGVLAGVALVCALLAVLSRLGLPRVDASGDARGPADVAAVVGPRLVSATAYREPTLHELVARAHTDAVAAAACPLTYLPASPDPRRKES